MAGTPTYTDTTGLFHADFDLFTAARSWIHVDPLALDLDGDGIETVGAGGAILFDHDGDGTRTGSGWIKGDDGLLVWDRNGNTEPSTCTRTIGSTGTAGHPSATNTNPAKISVWRMAA